MRTVSREDAGNSPRDAGAPREPRHKAPAIARSSPEQAQGLWTAPADKQTLAPEAPVTPLNTLTAPLHLQITPLPVE